MRYGADAHLHAIAEREAKAGIELMRFFEAQQLIALIGLRGTAKAKLAERIMKILEAAPEGITARQARGMGLFPSTDKGQAEFDEMLKKGLIGVEDYQNPNGGPRTKRYFSPAARRGDRRGNAHFNPRR